ncbi:MAG: hypothetical protein HC854_00780 [Flavobacterium sp.]|nr:hypothetical protein [Flavobacterium sp.]
MFSIIKSFFLRKIINKKVLELNTDVPNEKIKMIGIIVDTTYFFDTEKLVSEIKSKNIPFKDIKVLSYNDKVKHKDSLTPLSYSIKDISINGEIKVIEVNDFLNYPFDLLISYFDEEKLPLLLAVSSSKAKFKVGFSKIDFKFNHFIIDSDTKEYINFISELFKYLKILNKIEA